MTAPLTSLYADVPEGRSRPRITLWCDKSYTTAEQSRAGGANRSVAGLRIVPPNRSELPESSGLLCFHQLRNRDPLAGEERVQWMDSNGVQIAEFRKTKWLLPAVQTEDAHCRPGTGVKCTKGEHHALCILWRPDRRDCRFLSCVREISRKNLAKCCRRSGTAPGTADNRRWPLR